MYCMEIEETRSCFFYILHVDWKTGNQNRQPDGERGDRLFSAQFFNFQANYLADLAYSQHPCLSLCGYVCKCVCVCVCVCVCMRMCICVRMTSLRKRKFRVAEILKNLLYRIEHFQSNGTSRVFLILDLQLHFSKSNLWIFIWLKIKQKVQLSSNMK